MSDPRQHKEHIDHDAKVYYLTEDANFCIETDVSKVIKMGDDKRIADRRIEQRRGASQKTRETR